LRLSPPLGELLLQTPRLEVGIAGAEANVGVALAQLGHGVSMVSALPNSRVGDAPLQALRSHGIDCTGIMRTPGRMGLYFVEPGAGARSSDVIYDRAHSAFLQVPPEHWDWNAHLAGAGRLHLSGITPALGAQGTQTALRAAEAAERASVPLSFDSNYRAKLWESWDSNPRATLARLISKADILFGNHRDIALVLDRPFAGDGATRRRQAAEAAFAVFPNLKLIASTARHVETSDVHRLSARVDRPDRWHETDEIVISGIIDRVGTGDAFAAGILHALVSGQDDAGVAHFGLALARYKHSIAGDQVLIHSRDLTLLMEEGRDVRR